MSTRKSKNKIACNDFLLRSFTLFLKYKIKNILRRMVRLSNKTEANCLRSSAEAQQLQRAHSASFRLAGQLALHKTILIFQFWLNPLRTASSLLTFSLFLVCVFVFFWIEVFLFRDVLVLCEMSPMPMKNNNNFICTLRFFSQGHIPWMNGL